MNVLVTGGAGFIGSHLCDRLVARGDQVTVLDDLSTGRSRNLQAALGTGNLRFVRGSVLDRELVEELVSEAELVVHFAAVVGVRLVLEQAEQTVHTNVEGTRIVLSAVARRGARCLLASSSEVYGSRTTVPFREDDPLLLGATDEARWVYACSKELGERLSLAHVRRTGLDVRIVRFFNTVGPRQRARFGMVLPNLVRQALAGDPLTVFGDGNQRRTFVHVRDSVAACLAVLEAPAPLHPGRRVFNVGGTQEISMLDLARLVKRTTKSASEIVLVPYREAYVQPVEDPQRRVPDIARLVEHTGFRPRIGLREIVSELARDSAGSPALAV